MTEAVIERNPSKANLVNQISNHLAKERSVLTTGEVAELRRMDPRRLDAPGFFKLVGAVLDPVLPPGGEVRDELEIRWASIVVGLAHLGTHHRPGVRLGQALVDAGFSELRFIRLLRADTERLIDEIPALARFLAAKNMDADFSGAARLLLHSGRKEEEETRRRIARDYYGALYQKNKE